jgi:phosphatidate cytidylyltransferase
LSGAIYIGWTLAHFILMRQIHYPLRPNPLNVLRLDAGAAWIVLGLAVTFVSDTVAYIVGRSMGRHRMAPYISPKKSWEGSIGGLVGAVLAGILLVPLLGLPISLAAGALLGGIGSAAGQAGDLAESLLKRQVGVKDSGHLIPGHGGLLDRADSLLFTIPTLYYLVVWLTGT